MSAGSRRSEVPLAERTSFGIGGPAARILELACDVDVVLSASGELREPDCFVLGGGTNVLVADDGYRGTIVRFDESARLDPLGSGRYRVSANTSLDVLVSLACRAGLYGLERLAGIPGSVGGAVVQNAGAYDQQIAGVIESVVCVNCHTAEVEILSVHDCRMSYRDSIFKDVPGSRVIVECTVQLTGEGPLELKSAELMKELSRGRPRGCGGLDLSPPSISDAVRAVRGPKDHLVTPTSRSAGSFFKNPRSTADDPRVLSIVREFLERRDLLIANGAHWVSADSDVVRNHEDGQRELIASLLIATATDPSDLDVAYTPGY